MKLVPKKYLDVLSTGVSENIEYFYIDTKVYSIFEYLQQCAKQAYHLQHKYECVDTGLN